MNIAILGFGVVGSGVYEVLKENRNIITSRTNEEINVKYILDLRDFPDFERKEIIIKDFERIVNDKSVDVVVECMGGSHPAYDFSLSAIEHGKSVVTSNKEVVSKFGRILLEKAKENGVKYMFEASVGGGTPIIRPLERCLAANEIECIYGILNGTTNYILTMMNKYSESFDKALLAAQEKGYAEKDPSDDINGIDTLRKICILSDIASGMEVKPDAVHAEGITSIRREDVKMAEKWGGSIKLFGRFMKVGDKFNVTVSPFVVPYSRMISTVDGVFNAVSFTGNAVGEVTHCGRGAGKRPTASAMVADVIDIARGEAYLASYGEFDANKLISDDDIEDKYYIALSCNNADNADEIVKKVFEDVGIIGESDGEIYAVTSKIKRSQLSSQLDSLKNNGIYTINKIRVLD